MRLTRTLGSLSLVFVAACSQPKQPAQTELIKTVDPQKVETIVLAQDAKEQKACEAAIENAGGKILYRSESGALFTDSKLSSDALAGCRAEISANTKLDIPRESTGKGAINGTPDLSTLLRLIPAEEIGARSFVAQNPEMDGRGIVVAILDTGIELDHPMLKKSSDGSDKIVDFQDFSGEGRVALSETALGADGKIVVGGVSYNTDLKGVSGVNFGVFKGSTLSYAQEASAADKFVDVGVISYRTSEGKIRGKIDTNNNKDFNDEAELFDFGDSRAFTKLGEKRSLTTALTLSADGRVATLCFDDGSHGTHVAGITAGFDPKGLIGVAPGAKVVAAKIGDNRLSGGSTTTASMMLAIDFAVKSNARVINLSYGIRGGSNLGKSAIDQYVDKVAREKGILFSISAGNEGPGLLTIGTPAGASLAITNGAYVSKQTAKDNYGYVGFDDDTIWFFSSIGPLANGGWKPSILAPGTALSSTPIWKGMQQNYRGTSMASPQVTGGLALVLSAAKQKGLPMDRANVTQAVFQSARPVAGLLRIEQGHGLMSVPGAVQLLEKAKGASPVEYGVSVNSPTSPDGKGLGIYARARVLPANLFTVTITPQFATGVTQSEKDRLRTLRLESSSMKIKTPGSLWIAAAARTFQIELDNSILDKTGVFSEVVSGIDEATGQLLFEVPVNVIVPTALNDANQFSYHEGTTLRVGQTIRRFIDVPAGATSIQVDLTTDGQMVWGQLLDPEGRKVLELMDTERTIPQPPLLLQSAVKRPGVYELDLVAPPYNKSAAKVQTRVQAFSLAVTRVTEGAGSIEFSIQNNFSAVKFVPKIEQRSLVRKEVVTLKEERFSIPVSISEEDTKTFSAIRFNVKTSKAIYDLMTDYPYWITDKDGGLAGLGGLELDSDIALDSLGDLAGGATLNIQGSFTKEAPKRWGFSLTEERVLKTAKVLFNPGKRILLETGQMAVLNADLNVSDESFADELNVCAVLNLSVPGGRTIQDTKLCD